MTRAYPDPARLTRAIEDTLLHEIAHHFGIDDDRLHALRRGGPGDQDLARGARSSSRAGARARPGLSGPPGGRRRAVGHSRWAAATVGPGARVRSVRPLGGGIAEATDALTIDDRAGRRHRLVLQRWIRPGWEADDPGFDPAKEAAVLAALEGTAIPAPRLAGVDPDGSWAGVPALLTARLPGRPPTVARIGRPATTAALGTMLAAIHRVGADLVGDRALLAVVPPYRPFGDLADAVVPTASRRRDLWATALALAALPPPAQPAILIHRDFHAWNTLWLGDRLTGVVDWTSASWGPPAADLAHLRVDLVVDVSVAAAVRARDAFAAAGGDLANARHHQLRTVFDYLTDTDPAVLTGAAAERLDAFLELVLAEADGPDRTG